MSAARGIVRKRGKTYGYIIELGSQRKQRCDCGFKTWVERKPLETCPKCGGELHERLERRQQETRGFKTEDAAKEALNAVLGKLQEGSYVEPAKITLSEHLDKWLLGIRPSVKPSTLLSYQMHVDRHLKPGLGSYRIQKLTPAMLKVFYANLAIEPRKPVEQPKRKAKPEANQKPEAKEQTKALPPLSALTIKKIHATLHKALGDAVESDLIPRNPAERAKPAGVGATAKPEMKTWTAEQLQAFLVSTKETRLYPLWLALATTGMRRGEALGLRWEDVDVEKSRLSIRQNRVSVGYKVEIGNPKTGRGRSVSLDPLTVAVLKDVRKRQLEEKMEWQKAGYVDSGYVFRREDGAPLHPDLVSQSFERAVKRSGQPRIRLHDLRHTHATLALQAGIHPKVVSERLGHASITITLDVYSHAIPALHEEAAATIAALFVPAQSNA